MSTGVPNINPGSSSSNAGGKPPSQLKGHAKWVKGVANETIGNLTSSPSWQASGAADKAEGIGMMRAAKERVDTYKQQNEYPRRGSGTLKAEGQTEGILGRTLGCGGMEERGTEKVTLAERKRSGDLGKPDDRRGSSGSTGL
ncbi:hypothetical protein EDC01DRAFT_764726 [Geopyxis carbonaria]|nr:hypothetical protein EDC01DRAFT_764726 [Geopyxis carbonaria]